MYFQLFSILAHELKTTDIRTVDELKSKILNSPIQPKPIVESLFYIWNWRDFIEDKLHPLSYHTFFNSFKITKELGEVRFRYKKLPQSPEYGPKEGMKLVEAGINLEPVGSADFRIEKLELDKLMKNLETVFQPLPITERMSILTSWAALKKTLEALPIRKDSMPKMDLNNLPKRSWKETEESNLDVEEEIRDIEGVFHEDDVCEGDVDDEVVVGMDVCVYTNSKIRRPWVGIVTNLNKEDATLELHWYEKDKASKSNRYKAMFHKDGTSNKSEVSKDTVMLYDFAEHADENSFVISPFWFSYLKAEYAKLD